ncbi:sigma-54-dependent Fis family transcriptional regulator [Brachymonas denitrificans]|jgi:DNA-binding NtrC family response regulator|uniref:sigma-54 interaction domain-containing protein n=1 Tax=Brachymonas denitrificans TaxID=28220 RepID=UPI001BCB29C3|nr:sigma-54-dependent Fis family transcriptional regulator [Brachymonas denitrificans]
MSPVPTDTLPHEMLSYLDSLPEPHIVCDSAYRIRAANAAYQRIYGHSAAIIGQRCHEASHRSDVPCDQAGETCPLAQALQSGQRERVLHLHHTPQGEEYVQIELAPIRNARGELRYFIEKMEPLRMHAPEGGPRLTGTSPAFRRMLEMVSRVAPSEASVLLHGESGTGKELVAHALHESSNRRSHAFVVVECASLAETLFESELFGHEKGAFTGASQSKPGLVEAASGGTLFLDEVGDIPLSMQVKLLRLLETGTYRRVGSTELRHVDVRLISASHRSLPDMVAAGKFRQDLYYRLSTFPIRLPPLRERVQDIPALAAHLLQRLAPGRDMRLSAAALHCLQTWPFPGNVRELRNVLERACLLADGEVLDAALMAQALQPEATAWQAAAALPGAYSLPASAASPGHGTTALADAGSAFRAAPVATLQQLERQALLQALQRHAGNRAELARALGISERTLYRRLRQLQQETGHSA